jgi:hypothetical protein
MKVGKSTNVISHDVSSALKLLVAELGRPEYLTTDWSMACFIDTIEKWFCIVTWRHPTLAINKFNPYVYKEAIQFLQDFIIIIKDNL